jgi:glycosyltransferase involved in cell wall biosynthesis
MIDRFVDFNLGGWELDVAGRGRDAYVAQLKAKTINSSIRWLGWVESSTFLKNLDALIVPSLWEDPLPRVILEAYGHSVPVIAANRGGIPEVVEHEVSGLVFDPSEPTSFDRSIKRVLNSSTLLRRLREGARAKAIEFGVARMVAGYVQAYSTVLQNEGRD